MFRAFLSLVMFPCFHRLLFSESTTCPRCFQQEGQQSGKPTISEKACFYEADAEQK